LPGLCGLVVVVSARGHSGFVGHGFSRAVTTTRWAVAEYRPRKDGMIYQLGWTTLPGLHGLACGGFRATPTAVPDNDRGVSVEFASDAERDEFLRQIEEYFSSRRFHNAADAFDSVKAWALAHAGNDQGTRLMRNANERTVQVLRRSAETFLQSKDGEYAYWQSRPPIERLAAMQELSFAFFEERGDDAEIRQQFLRSPVCLPRL